MRCAGIGDEAGVTLPDQLTALRELDWHHIELRSVDGHAIADLDHESFAALAAGLDEAGFSTAAVDSRIGNWARPVTHDFALDLAELAVLADRCARLGTRLIRVMSYPNDGLAEPEWRARVVARLRELAVRAEAEGLILAHENCSGWAATDPQRALDLIDDIGSPAFRLLFDTGNGLAHGYDAATYLRPVAEHVVHVHVKDGDGTDWTLPGCGKAGIPECLSILADAGYDGLYSLEPHLTVRPHQGASTPDPAQFVAAGRALLDLLGDR